MDGYNAELGIAFEHHGHQHYFKSDFYRSQRGFRGAVFRDIIKRRLCRNNGVKLVTIPMLGHYLLKNEGRLKEYLAKKFHRLAIIPPPTFDSLQLDLNVVYHTSYHRELLEEFRANLLLDGRKLLEEDWLGDSSKHKVLCSCGKECTAVPNGWKKTSCRPCIKKKKNQAYQYTPRIKEPIDELIVNLTEIIESETENLPDSIRAKILRGRIRQKGGDVPLLPYQEDALRAIGIFDEKEWDEKYKMGSFRKRKEDEDWERNYRDAVAFQRDNDHVMPPAKTFLCGWISEQRRKKKEGRLPKEREKKLNKIPGFWENTDEIRRANKQQRLAKARNQKSIAKWIPLLKEYYEENGHLNVPRDYLTPQKGYRLGGFISSARGRYHRKKDDGRRELGDDMINTLNELEGWLWVSGRYKNKPRHP